MAINTQDVFLLKSTDGTTYTKLVDIKDFPDLGSNVSNLETTTLSNHSQTYIQGLHQVDALEFTINYDPTDFSTIKTLETAGTELYFAVAFGLTNSVYGGDGVFKFKGTITVGVAGGGVDEVVEAKVTILPSTDIEFDSSL